MTSPDRPQWQERAQMYVLPKWGTKAPLNSREIILPLFSRNGRPLLEKHKGGNPARVAFNFIDSPFDDDDKRQGGLQNDPAYKSVVQDFNEALGVISYIRSRIHPYERRPTFDGIYSAVNAVSVLPYFLVMRADGTPLRNGEIPDDVAAAVKISRGFNIPFDIQRALQIDTRYTGKKVPRSSFWQTAEGFVDYVFQNGLLVSDVTIVDDNDKGKRKHITCPASRPIISRVAETIWDTPSEQMREAGERLTDLGVSDRDFARLKSMGSAYAVFSVEEKIFEHDQKSARDRSNRRKEESIQAIFFRTRANALAEYNAALGRR